MGLRLYYVESISPYLDEILSSLVQKHLDFKLRDSFRILTPDAQCLRDLEEILLTDKDLEGVLIGKSLLSLEQFWQEILSTHPQIRPIGTPTILGKALRLALKLKGGYHPLDLPTQKQYLREFNRVAQLGRIQTYSSPDRIYFPPLLKQLEKILVGQWGLWTREVGQKEAWKALSQGGLTAFKELQEVFFLGFSQLDGELLDAVTAFQAGYPEVTLHLFIPPPDQGVDAQGLLAPLYDNLEKNAQEIIRYQALPRPHLQGHSFPTPFHEAHALAPGFLEHPDQHMGFHGGGKSSDYLKSLLEEAIGPWDPMAAPLVNASIAPIKILHQVLKEKDAEKEIYFKELFGELLPKFSQWREAMACGGSRIALRHLEHCYALLQERARWEGYQEELRSCKDWLEELQEDFSQALLTPPPHSYPPLPLRNLLQIGLKRIPCVHIFQLNEGIFPRKWDPPLISYLSQDSLWSHEAYLKLKAAMHLASEKVTFSYVEKDMEGRIQSPSPLWERFLEDGGAKKANIPLLLETGEHPFLQENTEREKQRLLGDSGSLDRGDLQNLNLGPLISEIVQERPLSASYLDDYAKCPWKFFARWHLHLEEPMEWRLEMEPKIKGFFAHSLLEKTYQQLIKNFFSQGKLPEDKDWVFSMEQALTSCQDEWRGLPEWKDLTPRILEEEVRRLTLQVQKFLKMESDQWKKSSIPLYPKQLEWRFGSPPLPKVSITLKNGSKVPLAGAIDRIDYNSETEEYLLIDYKSSGSEALSRQLREGLSYQLFLYLHAVGQALYPQGSPLGALYGDLKKTKKNQGLAKKGPLRAFGLVQGASKSFVSSEDFATIEKKLSQGFGESLEKVLEGSYPLAPKECQGSRCPYHEICRYDHQPR